ncbi:hypothetical protein EJB05_34325, partial [Eragrostis curvula]
MESPPSDDDGFEHVEYEGDFAGCTDDEYEFVEAPVERSAAPAPAAHAQPVGGGGGVIAAHEDDDGGDNQVFSPPAPETIIGCDQGSPAKTIVQVMPPPSAVAPPRSSPPTTTMNAHAEEEKMASPFGSCGAAAAQDAAATQAPRYDLVHVWDVAELFRAPMARRYVAADGEAGQYDDDEASDEDEDDGLYEYYDFADFGRARRVKRSSGRRGRTKKASAMGRPRGEARSSHIAGSARYKVESQIIFQDYLKSHPK